MDEPEEEIVGGRPLTCTWWHGRRVTASTAWFANKSRDLGALSCMHGRPLNVGCSTCEERP